MPPQVQLLAPPPFYLGLMGCGASAPPPAPEPEPPFPLVHGRLPAGLWHREAGRLTEWLQVEADGSCQVKYSVRGHFSRAWSCAGAELQGTGRVVSVTEELETLEGGEVELAAWTVEVVGEWEGERPKPHSTSSDEEQEPDEVELEGMSRKQRQRARDVREQRQRSRAILAAMDSVGWPEEEEEEEDDGAADSDGRWASEGSPAWYVHGHVRRHDDGTSSPSQQLLQSPRMCRATFANARLTIRKTSPHFWCGSEPEDTLRGRPRAADALRAAGVALPTEARGGAEGTEQRLARIRLATALMLSARSPEERDELLRAFEPPASPTRSSPRSNRSSPRSVSSLQSSPQSPKSWRSGGSPHSPSSPSRSPTSLKKRHPHPEVRNLS